MHIRIIGFCLTLLISACGGSSSNTGGTSGPPNDAVPKRMVEEKTHDVTAEIPGAGVVAWRWSDAPIREDEFGACANTEGFDVAIAARSLASACTSAEPGNCEINFLEVPDDGSGITKFKVSVPKLRAPIGLVYRLQAEPSAGTPTSSDITFCLVTVNEMPTANDDSFTVIEGEETTFSIDTGLNLLSNDEDDDDSGNLPLRVNTTPVRPPTLADQTTLTLAADGGFTYFFQGAANIPADQKVEDSFEYEVTDGVHKTTAVANITIVTNDKPPLSTGEIPSQSYSIGQDIDFDLDDFFTDPEGSDLLYEVDTNTLPPSGELTITPSGKLEGTTEKGDENTYQIFFAVSDQVSTGSQANAPLSGSITVQILGNEAPVLVAPIADQTLQFGEEAKIDASKSFDDPENDPLRYRMSTKPESTLRINSKSGVISGKLVKAGKYEVTVSADDGFNSRVSTKFTIEQLKNPNKAPVVNKQPTSVTVPVVDPATGTISGTPTKVDNARLRIKATDPSKLSAETAIFFITVEAVVIPNNPPKATKVIAPQTVTVGQPITAANAVFTDEDNDPLTYTIAPATLPAGYVFNAQTGVLTGVPTVVGETTFTITASDGEDTGNSNAFKITVEKEVVINLPPTAGTPVIPAQSVTVGNPITNVSGQFTDPEGASLTYSISPAVGAGLSFSTTTGVLSGSPSVVGGPVTYTITASDGPNKATATFALTVIAAINNPPVSNSDIDGQSVEVNTPITNVVADFSDEDGDTLTYSIAPAAAPSGLNFNTSTGVLSGTPTVVGPLTYVISATDGKVATPVPGEAFTITVTSAVNNPPEVGAPLQDQTINPGDPIGSLDAEFTDQDGDTLTFAAFPAGVLAGSGLTLSPAGVISGVPNFSIPRLAISAFDGTDTTTSNEISISIRVVNIAPEQVGTIGDMEVFLNIPMTPVSATFEDPDDTVLTYSISPTVSPAVDGFTFVDGVLAGTPLVLQDYDFTITATDTKGATGDSNEFKVTVSSVEVIEIE